MQFFEFLWFECRPGRKEILICKRFSLLAQFPPGRCRAECTRTFSAFKPPNLDRGLDCHIIIICIVTPKCHTLCHLNRVDGAPAPDRTKHTPDDSCLSKVWMRCRKMRIITIGK